MRDLRDEVRRRLSGLQLAPAREAEIVDEIALHLDERRGELMAGGATADEAAAAALAELDDGDVLERRLSRIERRAVDAPVAGGPRGRGLLTDLWHDLRHGVRALRKSPTFTLVTLLSLTLGIGANTTIFQLLDAIHMRELPVAAPDELVTVRVRDRPWIKGLKNGWHFDLTYPLWEQLRGDQGPFSAMAAWGDIAVNLAPSGAARQARGLLVSGDFFHVLGVRPVLGRLFTSADDRPGCGAPGAVVSHGFWQRDLGGDPGAVGRTLSLDGHRVSIVGVTAPGFFGPEVGRGFDFAVPICMEPTLLPAGKDRLGVRHWWWLSAIGRLAPGWSIDEATAHLAARSPAMMEATVPDASYFTADEAARYQAYRLAAYPAATGISALRERYTAPLCFLLATSALVLLIACANLANLLLARASAREREIAVRLAVGASRSRLVRQLMTESMLLAAVGAGLALLLARGLAQLLVAFLGTRDATPTLELDPDLYVLAFTAALAALTCLVFGLVPALRAARTDVGLVLKDLAPSAGGGRLRLPRALVVAQVALSFLLLVGALLFARSFRNLATVDPGLRTAGVLVLDVDLRPLDLPADRLGTFRRQLLERVRSAPAVGSAASCWIVPVTGRSSFNLFVWMDGVTPRQDTIAYFNHTSPGYLGTLELPLLAGRDFRDTDGPHSPKVAIVSEALARALTGGEDPVGRRLRAGVRGGETQEVYEIVGLVKDTKYELVRDDIRPLIYLPEAQDPEPDDWMTFLVRPSGPLADLVGSMTRVLAEVAPQAIFDHGWLDEEIGETLVRERLMAALSGFFGLLAALLAGVGLYGVVAYGVARRTHEIGVRMALGADRRRIAAMFLRETLGLVVLGLAVGLVLALLATRAAGALLYGLEPHDPLTLALAAAFMAAIAAVAGFVPAWRGASVDPMVALRRE